MRLHLPSERESQQLATRLAACIMPPLIMTFTGDIGMGKTTLIRALLRSLGVLCAIKSPTFSLVESYDISLDSQKLKTMTNKSERTDSFQLHHFDLYRIMDETELEYIGFRDYFGEQSICCIEWPERAPHCMEHVDISFTLTRNKDGRDVQIESLSSAGNMVISFLDGGVWV